MEGILYQRVTPLLKCVVLFLFIFTAKVLTTRPHETQDGKNSIYHQKPTHFVRTFTKYHHRRTIQWPHDNWPTDDHPKVIQKRNAKVLNGKFEKSLVSDFKKIVKRSVENQNSNEFIDSGSNDLPLSLSESLRDNFDKTAISSQDERPKGVGFTNKNSVSNDAKKYKVKPAFIPTEQPTTVQSTVSCLYKTNNMAKSVTPSYNDDKNAQLMVENEIFDSGSISMETLGNGEVVQVEQCTDPKAYCYTFWYKDSDGNITVLGQGCWRSSRGAGASCGRCVRTPRLPHSTFCCCTSSYCNRHFLTMEDETVTIAAESTLSESTGSVSWRGAVAALLALLACLVAAALTHRRYCGKRACHRDAHKGDAMDSRPDALATGLLCVDNLTLIEHIGQGKFGSVWRGSLGSIPVAVKLYSNASAWQKEAAIYDLPHLSHSNLLRYYGSDTRPTLDGGREHLLVLELCESTLRARLERAPLTWAQFAHLAHGLASALAHLHTATGSKPCVVHRDVNSNNVLIVSGEARLADLGLAQAAPPRHAPPPSRIAEAGTLRYLAPEALEGALDLSEAGAALCAVDVYALGLVLWEMLWRCEGAHAGPAPSYAPPYHTHRLPARPSQQAMQSVVSRSKARPPLPSGPVRQQRALRLCADTCAECWDHDAEARLTAVCVEERMAELKQMLRPPPPLTLHNPHPHSHPADAPPSENDKNSNCTSAQTCDVSTPLLYPPPELGRNACIERNTHTHHNNTVTLIHKSLKDITAPTDQPKVQNIQEQCLSVARVNPNRPTIDFENSDRLTEIRSYQRPLEYVPNDVSRVTVTHEGKPKQTNLLQDVKVEKPTWGIRKFFERTLGKNKLETEVKLVSEANGVFQNGTKTSLVNGKDRPSNLVLDQERSFNFEAPCTLSPPNRTLSPTMLIESHLNRENRVFGFKELPSTDEKQNHVFAVIVPKANPSDFAKFIEIQNKSSSDSTKTSVRTCMSSQSFIKSGHSESEDSTVKRRLSCDNRILSNSGSSSRASINLELQYMDNMHQESFQNDSPFDINSDCSSSEDEHLMLLSENGGSKITMQAVPKPDERKKYQNDVLKESMHKTDIGFNYQNRYKNFDNEFSDPNDKENLVNGYSGDNPVYIAALNGEIDTADLKFEHPVSPKSPKPSKLPIKRQHSLEQVSEIFSSSGDVSLQNPAGRVKTPGDIPVAIRRARRDRALQKGRANESNRLSLYDDRMMFGNSL